MIADLLDTVEEYNLDVYEDNLDVDDRPPLVSVIDDLRGFSVNRGFDCGISISSEPST